MEKRRRILGEEHPSKITAMNNLAATLGEQGQLDETMALLEATIQRMKLILGHKHPHTKIPSGTFARLRGRTASAQKPEGRFSSKESRSLAT